MKIVCEACAAKYSIADDKVRGKVFKIRCKKCSHIIVVRGTGDGGGAAVSTSPVPAAPVAPEPSGGTGAQVAQWYVVVEGEQVGPLTEGDVVGRISRGDVSGETYAWREGMADWSQLASISEFSQASAGRAAAPSAAGAAAYDDNDSPFAPQPTAIMPPGQAEDMFKRAGAGAPANDDFFGNSAATAISAPPPDGDLFAPQASAPVPARGGGEGMFAAAKVSPSAARGRAAPAAAPAGDAFFPAASGGDPFGGGAEMGESAGGGAGLTGQRSENSVLFSLSNLEALASPAAGRSASPSFRSPVPAPSGTTEGSGLIDIRAMANITLGSRDDGPSGGGGSSAMSDFPSFSAVPFSPVSAPLLPMRQSSGMPKWAIGLIVAGVLLVGGMGFALVSVMSRSDDAPAPAADDPFAKPSPVAVAPAAAPAAAAPSAAPSAEPPETPPPAPAVEAPSAAAAPAASGDRNSGSRKPSRSGSSKPSSSRPEPSRPDPVVAAAPVRAAPVEEKPKKSGNSLDDLLAGALGSGGAKREPGGGDAPAPDRGGGGAKKTGPLEKTDIVKVMNGLKPKISACYQSYKVRGAPLVNIKVDDSGKVSSAKVTGKFAGTPSGDCVEKAIAGARFPASDSGLGFPYPVSLQ